MAILYARGRTPLAKLSTATLFPTALVTLFGDETLTRNALRARGWLQENWTRGVKETQSSVKPLREVAQRELKKGRKLESVIPFFPAIPLIPLAVIAGLTTFSTIMAVRNSRHDRDIMGRLDAIEKDLERLRERQQVTAVTEEKAKPAQLPWT